MVQRKLLHILHSLLFVAVSSHMQGFHVLIFEVLFLYSVLNLWEITDVMGRYSRPILDAET